MGLRKFTKKVATIHVVHGGMSDGRAYVDTITVMARADGSTEDVSRRLFVGDTLDISTDAEVPAPDGGRSLVKASWVALLDLLGYKEMQT